MFLKTAVISCCNIDGNASLSVASLVQIYVIKLILFSHENTMLSIKTTALFINALHTHKALRLIVSVRTQGSLWLDSNTLIVLHGKWKRKTDRRPNYVKSI